MFLPDPMQACYRCADDGVRSPADNNVTELGLNGDGRTPPEILPG